MVPEKAHINNILIVGSLIVTAAGIVLSLLSGNGMINSLIGFGSMQSFGGVSLDSGNVTILSLIGFQFLHGGLIHLYMNLSALKDLGAFLEKSIGTKNYAWLFAISSISVTLAALAFYPAGTHLAGISGFAFAVCGFLIPFTYSLNLRRYATPLTIAMVLNFSLAAFIPFISMTAHLVGFASGLVCFLLFRWKYNEAFFHYSKKLLEDMKELGREDERIISLSLRSCVAIKDGEKWIDESFSKEK